MIVYSSRADSVGEWEAVTFLLFRTESSYS